MQPVVFVVCQWHKKTIRTYNSLACKDGAKAPLASSVDLPLKNIPEHLLSNQTWVVYYCSSKIATTLSEQGEEPIPLHQEFLQTVEVMNICYTIACTVTTGTCTSYTRTDSSSQDKWHGYWWSGSASYATQVDKSALLVNGSTTKILNSWNTKIW